MPSRWNDGGIRTSVTSTWGSAGGAAGHDPVVVGGHPDHAQVGVALDERAYPLADDQVVVGEEHVDCAVRLP